MSGDTTPTIPPRALRCLDAVEFAGADAAQFLQGQLTINTQTLAAGRWRWAAACTRQGRVVAAGMLGRVRDDLFVFAVAAGLAEPLVAMLSKYIMRAKVKIRALAPAVQWAPAAHADDADITGGKVAADDAEQMIFTTHAGSLQFSLAADANAKARATEGAGEADAQWQQTQIAAGIAWATPEQQEQFLPQFLNYDRIGGIDFDKGCYVGQEVIIRLHNLGEVKRRAVIVKSDSPLVAGTAVHNAAGEKSGVILNAAGSTAIAILKTADTNPQATLTTNSHPLHIQSFDKNLK